MRFRLHVLVELRYASLLPEARGTSDMKRREFITLLGGAARVAARRARAAARADAAHRRAHARSG